MLDKDPQKDPNPFDEYDILIELEDDIFVEESPKKPVLSYLVVGFLVPIIGFILFLSHKKDRKEEAEALLDGTIIGIFTYTILTILIIGYLLSSK
ncbi:MAG: hypothetical protein WC939_02970 [Acholeplasmataceae bacterium]